MEFIKDKPREELFAKIKRRIDLKKSTNVYGLHGSGKSRILLELAKLYGGKVINCCDNTTQILGEMAGVDEPFSWHIQRYKNKIKKKQGNYFLDEGQKMTTVMYDHLKSLVDAGCVFVIASKAHKEDGEIVNELESKLRLNHYEDVLERFKREEIQDVMLQPIEDFMKKGTFDDVLFEKEAVETVLMECTSMRTIADVFDECILFAKQNGVSTVTNQLVNDLL